MKIQDVAPDRPIYLSYCENLEGRCPMNDECDNYNNCTVVEAMINKVLVVSYDEGRRMRYFNKKTSQDLDCMVPTDEAEYIHDKIQDQVRRMRRLH